MSDLALGCQCGAVRGRVKNVNARSGNRLICCCEHCQAFANSLGRGEDILDLHGGTDIFQTSPASIEVTQGQDLIRCLRLTEKGPYRWYADCCKTPIGNTMGAGMPFVGLIHGFWANKNQWKEVFGPPRVRVQTKHAINLPEDAPEPVGFPLRVTLKMMLKILGWKLGRKGRPNPFFSGDGAPISTPRMLSKNANVNY